MRSISRLSYIAILLVGVLTLAKAEEKASIRLNFTSFGGEQSYLEIGVSDMATDTFDIEYDQEQPPFPPPGGMMPLIRLKNGVRTDGQQQYTDVNIDIRYAPAGAIIEKTFRFDILGSFSQTPWTVCWSNPPAELKSAVMRDIYIPDTYQFEIDLINETSVSCGNPYVIDKPLSIWEVVTTWELEPNSIEDIDNKPAPYEIVGNSLVFDKAHDITIYNMLGKTYLKTTSSELDVSGLNKGVYIIVSEFSGKKYIDRFVK